MVLEGPKIPKKWPYKRVFLIHLCITTHEKFGGGG